MQRIAKLILIAGIACFSGCSEDKTGDQATESLSQIQEEPLPKGQTIVEVPTEAVRLNDPVTPLGSKDLSTAEADTKSASADKTAFFAKKFANLLVFHVKDTMEVKKPKLATLILTKDGSVNMVKADILEAETPTARQLKIDTAMELGSKMRAKLIPFSSTDDDETFKVEDLGDEVQSFRGDRKQIVWQWKVTPLKEGNHELRVAVQVLEKDDERTSLPVKNIKVMIHAKKETTMEKIGDFLERKWEFVITAILIPVIVAVATASIRSKGDKPQKKSPH